MSVIVNNALFQSLVYEKEMEDLQAALSLESEISDFYEQELANAIKAFGPHYDYMDSLAGNIDETTRLCNEALRRVLVIQPGERIHEAIDRMAGLIEAVVAAIT